MDGQELKKQADRLITGGDYDGIKPLLLSYKDITEHDNELAMTCYLCTIHEQEKAAGLESVFGKISDIDALLERYTALKFYLRRIDFDMIDDGMESFYQFLAMKKVSSYELLRVIDFSVVHKDKVLRIIQGEHFAPDSAVAGKPRTSGKETIEEGMAKGHDIVRTEAKRETEQEICFIICTNDQMYAKECIYYINHLIIPEGIAVDILTVEDAKSLTSAYNEAMQYSKAKYKVYLHQDTFIINPYFIRDCVELFRANPQIGMIGNVGVEKMPDSGVMWDTDRYGMLYEQHIYETELLANAIPSGLPYLQADAIDGFLMVTQYDVAWREDLFTAWDFYDCSQSKEFIKKGYQVAVPDMKEPWCVHDCGFINLGNYEKEREKFVREYLKFA